MALSGESIIKLTGYSTEAGLHSYDEGEEDEFRLLSNTIHGSTKVNTVVSSDSMSTATAATVPYGNTFNHCNVTIQYIQNQNNKNKRKMVIYDSSQSSIYCQL